MRISDWSSDVCSSDLPGGFRFRIVAHWRGCRTQSPSNRNLTCGNDDFPELRVRFHIAIGFGYIRQRKGPVDHGAKDPLLDPRTDELLAARSEEHTSELQSLMRISYAVFCFKKKK